MPPKVGVGSAMWLLESIDCNRTVDLGSMDAQTLSNTLWAFANIGECPRWIMDETARYMRPHEPQQQHIARARIVSLLSSRCSHRPCKLRQRERTHSHAFRNGPYGQRLCTLCHVRTGRPPVAACVCPFFRLVGLKIDEFSTADVANLVWSFAKLGAKFPRRFRRVVERFVSEK